MSFLRNLWSLPRSLCVGEIHCFSNTCRIWLVRTSPLSLSCYPFFDFKRSYDFYSSLPLNLGTSPSLTLFAIYSIFLCSSNFNLTFRERSSISHAFGITFLSFSNLTPILDLKRFLIFITPCPRVLSKTSLIQFQKLTSRR